MAPGSENQPEPERRRETRAPIELRVEYKRLNSFFADYTKNISKGGTFICTDRPLPIGTEFLFKLVIPTLEKPLSVKGRVHWIVTAETVTEEQEAGMGIGFIYDSEADHKLIEREVGELMIKSLGPALYRKLMGDR
jgi:type IV pilus assembly protein PilZ